jgi:hypothetical protein
VRSSRSWRRHPRDGCDQRPGIGEWLVVERPATDKTGVAARFPLMLALAVACVGMCVVPGDAVAHSGIGNAVAGGGRAHSASGQASTAAQTRLLLSDMSKPSQEMPAGVPSWYDWAEHPRTHPISSLMRTFHAFTAWGQLYQCSGARQTPGATVELRDLQAWVLLRGAHQWRRIQFSSDLGGAAFAEDYDGPTVPGRYSASSTGTSARLVSGHNFHFWPDAGRVDLTASDVAAVTVALEARLQSNPAAGPCLVLSVGGDMWSSLGGTESGDVGIGRFKRVGSRWRLFTMTTATAGVLNQTPVPPMSPAADDF